MVFDHVFLNGEIVPLGCVRISPTDRGFTLADGAFETLCVRAERCIDVSAHLARLRDALTLLRLPPVHQYYDLPSALERTRLVNHIAEGVLRLTVTRGVGVRGLAPSRTAMPTVCIVGFPRLQRSPTIRAVIAAITRRNESSPLCRIKSLSYQDNLLALNEALEQGADDAVMLNTKGCVVCATSGNLLSLIDNEIVTPRLLDGALPGTVRYHLLKKLEVRETALSPADFARASEIIVTNSLGIRRIAMLGEHRLSESEELFRRASAIYEDLR